MRKLLTLFVFALTLIRVNAVSDIWLGNNSVNWNTAANWVGSAVPITGTNILLMSSGSAGAKLNNNIAAGLSINSLTYSNAASAYTLQGNSFTITSGITNLSANAQAITNAIVLGASSTISDSGSGLNFVGIISGAFGITNIGSITFSKDNTFSGGLTINSGTTIVTNQVSGSSPLGSGNVTINNGATLQGNNQDSFGYSPNTAPANINIFGGTITVLPNSGYKTTMPSITMMGGLLTAPATATSGGVYAFFGDGSKCSITTLATNVTSVIDTMPSTDDAIWNQSTLTFIVASGTVVGGTYPGIDLAVLATLSDYVGSGVPWIKTGAGVMAWDNNNAKLGFFGAGSIVISNGTLQVGLSTDTANLTTPLGKDFTVITTNYATLKFGSSKGSTINNIIAGSGTLVNASGTNTLGATNTYTGATTISGGILKLAATGSISNSVSISLSAGATFDVSAVANVLVTNLTSIGTGASIGSTAAEIKGGTSINIGSTTSVFIFTPTGFNGDSTHPSLLVSSGILNMTNCSLTVSNSAATVLGLNSYLGSGGNGYRVAQVTGGTINGASTVSVSAVNAVSGSRVLLSSAGANLVMDVIPKSWTF